MTDNTKKGIQDFFAELLTTLEPEPTAWYNEPWFLTVLSIIFGGFLLNILLLKNGREESRRNKAVETLQNLAVVINSSFAYIYAIIREEIDLDEERKIRLIKLKGELFKHRFLVKVSSVTIFTSKNAAKNYDRLVFEYRLYCDALLEISNSNTSSDKELIKIIKYRTNDLKNRWPLEQERELKEIDLFYPENLLCTSLQHWFQAGANRALSFLIESVGKETGKYQETPIVGAGPFDWKSKNQ